MTLADSYADLVNNVDDVRSQWRLRRLLEGACAALVVALGVLLVATVLDQLGDFARAGRVVLALVFWLVLCAGVWRLIIRPALTPHSDDYFAALLEQRLPVLGNRFINALQLGREDEPHCPALVDAIVTDAVEAINEAEPSRAVADAATRRNLLAAGIAVIIFFAYLLVLGPAARTSLLRVLLPTADIAPYTHTQLSLPFKQSLTIREGEPLTISAQARGRIPDQAHLNWIDADQRRRSVRLDKVEASFAYTFAAVGAPFRFQVTGGDARTPWVDVIVRPRPRIEAMSVTYAYPTYAALPDRTIDEFDGHLHGLAHTKAHLTVHTNHELITMKLSPDGAPPLALQPGDTPNAWAGTIELIEGTTYHIELSDEPGYQVEAAQAYTITIKADAAPMIRFTQPGRDLQSRPDDAIDFQLVASDDLGLGAVHMQGRVNASAQPVTLAAWPLDQGVPQRRVELDLSRTVAELGLQDGDRLEYWAGAVDRNTLTGPGKAKTRSFHILVLTDEQAQMLEARQLSDYAKVVAELIRLQRQNRAETAAFSPGAALVSRQSLIRRNTIRLADLMIKNAFPARTITDELRELAAGLMAQAMTGLEGYRDDGDVRSRKRLAQGTLGVQDQIIESLEKILMRLNRDQHVRTLLKKMKQKDVAAHEKVTARLEKLGQDLDKFLIDIKDIEEKYEKIAKRKVDELSGEELKALEEAEHRIDRWKKWSKDTVDDIAKLPEGFVKDSHLKDDINTIFEEIEKEPRGKTQEIATPVEEGVKALAQTVAEDVEIWMPHAGDSIRWVMEQPPEGKFDIPPYELPESLQDMIGDLIEDVAEFDEAADDITSTWGGNMAVGWDVMDGPISVFSAQGKTGNQLPNNSEITGRSGGGRRGKSSGQMVGSESRALEGRPTPARLTKERYEGGAVDASKQLDPRGATGGGKKTGGGARGLQGGTPPDYVKNMQRLTERQKLLREKMQQLAREFQVSGRSSWRLDRAVELMQAAEQDMRDRRYEDGARRRRVALADLRALHSGVDEAVGLSLQKARHVSPDMRKQITAAAQQPLPDGYEQLVGEYYKKLSEAGAEAPKRGEF